MNWMKRLVFAALMALALPAWSAATVSLWPMPKFQAVTSAGVPLVGGKLYTYVTGTSTPLATYTDSTGGTANANPVVLDSRGEANVWFDTTKTYRLVLKTAADVTLWTVDGVTQSAASFSFTQSGTGATARTVQAKEREVEINVMDFGAACDGSTNDDTAFANAITATPAGGTLVIPRGATCVLSSLATGKRIKIKGHGWHNGANAVFGNSAWTTTSNYGGSILKFTATTGEALKMGVSGSYATGVAIEDVMILGPGSGTSVGLQFGYANNEGVVQGIVRNVLIANFATCFRGKSVFESQLGVRCRGNSTGISLSNDSNNNEFFGWEVQYSTVDAILLDGSRGNTFYGGLVQNASAGSKGVRTATTAYNTKFYGTWFENSALAGTDLVIDAASGNSFGIYGGVVSGGRIKLSAPDARLDSVYIVGNTGIETTAGATGFIALNSRINGSGSYTAASPSATVIDHNGISTTDVTGGVLSATTRVATDTIRAYTAATNIVIQNQATTPLVTVQNDGYAKFHYGQIFASGSEPACASGTRGTLVMVQGGAGVADTFRICTKDAADAYAYRALY